MSYAHIRPNWLFIIAVVWALLSAVPASAQVRDSGERIFQEQLRVQMDQQQSAALQKGFDAGGWLSAAFFDFDDQDNKDRRMMQYQARLWAAYSDAGVHDFYVRGLLGFDDWFTDRPDGGGDKFHQPSLERGWYRFDFNRLIRNQTGQNPANGFTVKVGRDYAEIGSALVLALPLDAVIVTGNLGNWRVTGLLGKTVTHTLNIDNADPVRDHQDRCFWGGEIRYMGFASHQPYAYFLSQNDRTKEWPTDPNQNYSYDSWYVGAGSIGNLICPNLRYGTELVFEGGRSFGDGATRHQDEIHAMAFDLLLEYLFNQPRKPKLSFEYLFGSGDSDRALSATSAIGGNRPGTRDSAFNAFGFRDTGVAFAPGLANLHIFSVGASCLPFEQVRCFRKLEVGTKVFFYMKDTPGALSDTTGAGESRWAGWEWDAFANWKVTSDVSWTIRYGAFQPGECFNSEQTRNFLYTGVVYSF